MKFVGLNSSEQARRDFWRVSLGGNVLDAGLLLRNPLWSWPQRVNAWRDAVAAGKATLAATVSAPATTAGPLYGACAVVDVRVLGAEAGETVGAIARRLDLLEPGVAVRQVERVPSESAPGRDSALATCQADQCDPICALTRLVTTVLKVGALVAVVFVVGYAIRAVRK